MRIKEEADGGKTDDCKRIQINSSKPINEGFYFVIRLV